jgi:hypothetical protein
MKGHPLSRKGPIMAENEGISSEWTGHDLYDLNGGKIGTIEDVRYGEATTGLSWLVVKTGVFGTKKIFVPAGEVRHSGDRLTVGFTKDRVKNSPEVHDEQVLSDSDQQNLCTYYGLDYASPASMQPVEGCLEGEGDTVVTGTSGLTGTTGTTGTTGSTGTSGAVRSDETDRKVA